jgi:hypothetical protein
VELFVSVLVHLLEFGPVSRAIVEFQLGDTARRESRHPLLAGDSVYGVQFLPKRLKVGHCKFLFRLGTIHERGPQEVSMSLPRDAGRIFGMVNHVTSTYNIPQVRLSGGARARGRPKSLSRRVYVRNCRDSGRARARNSQKRD